MRSPPPAVPWLPILVIHIRFQVKTRQSYKFEKIAQNSNLEILQGTLHARHLLKLLDKMYKYKMDPTRTVRTTERTMDARQTQTDGQTEWNQYTPQQLRCDIGTGEIIQLTQLMAPSASDANQKNMGDYITKVYQELLIYPEQNNAQQKNVHTLTHCGLMMPYGDTDLGHHWFRWWLVAWWHQAMYNGIMS